MLTILGQHISLIRPSLGHQNKVYNDERPKINYGHRPKINKENTGKVIAICIKLKSGKIKSLIKGLHIDIMEKFKISHTDIATTGWKLDNGNYIWR